MHSSCKVARYNPELIPIVSVNRFIGGSKDVRFAWVELSIDTSNYPITSTGRVITFQGRDHKYSLCMIARARNEYRSRNIEDIEHSDRSSSGSIKLDRINNNRLFLNFKVHLCSLSR